MFSEREKCLLLALHLGSKSSSADTLEGFLSPEKIEPAIQFILKKDFSNAVRKAEEILHTHNKKNIHMITCLDENYPPLLREIKAAPLVLFCKGNLTLLEQKKISVVGTRNPSVAGIHMCREIVNQATQNGFIVVSGMAMGIDSMAHHTAVQNRGNTIGVLAHGLDHEYPVCNRSLYQRAKTDNDVLLISEYSLGTRPLRHHFLRRNRIISGLSAKTIFAEGGIKSGGLITVRYALEQGRDVLAIAHPEMRHNKGGEELIADGAINLATLMEMKISNFPEKIHETNPSFYLGTGKWGKINSTDRLTRLIEF